MLGDHLDKALPSLYVYGIPGRIGGASTKLAHLIRLLQGVFRITVVLPHLAALKDKEVKNLTVPYGVSCVLLRDLPKKLEGTALAVCTADFFAARTAYEIKERGLKLVWSNEMMFPFKGEAEAVKEGLIDRVLFVSEFQANAFAEMYRDVAAFNVGNYVDPDDYAWRERNNPIFTLGRVSRADVLKYPLDFPVFYEELDLKEVRYRVMAWSPGLQKQYGWHRFGPEWELLPANKEPVLKLLYTGHQFHKLMVHGESGFICQEYREFKATTRELYENYPLRKKVSQRCSEYAREHLCNPDEHRRVWIEALSL